MAGTSPLFIRRTATTEPRASVAGSGLAQLHQTGHEQLDSRVKPQGEKVVAWLGVRYLDITPMLDVGVRL